MTVDRFEPLSEYGETDFDGEGVCVMRYEEGRAAVVPVSVRRLDPEGRQAVRRVQETAARIHELQDELERLVLEGREEFGLSWNVVGWAIGTTGENARRRWGQE